MVVGGIFGAGAVETKAIETVAGPTSRTLHICHLTMQGWSRRVRIHLLRPLSLLKREGEYTSMVLP